eukprot:TRINITY_DN17374_c0_g1_i1.p1 TRINITY_DN17374_c0_g1~~TRINITY_DN17374_c0_g1_i1.p1  ORF type:complete len:386 (-),score=91.73 TRINITY_DN17374_c0_g1_i1:312-1469(-)
MSAAKRAKTDASVESVTLSKVAVLGGGAFGTAMAQHLATKGSKVCCWVMEPEVVTAINEKHENTVFLPGEKLSENVTATNDVAAAVADAEMMLLIIPTPFIARWVAQHQSKLPWHIPLLCCSKGIEEASLRTPYEILVDELPGKYHKNICVISGPSFAKEVVAGLPTNVTCAAQEVEVARKVQAAVSSRTMRIYTACDVVGAELCGAVKNVLAIACGASDGFGFGANSRSALITRGLAEMARLVVKKGGKAATVTGLAGVGDLVLTCSSSLSRNYSVGKRLAEGHKPDSGLAVAEGVKTSLALHKLASTLQVDMPICHAVYQVVHGGVPIKKALADLQSRPLRSEDDDVLGAVGAYFSARTRLTFFVAKFSPVLDSMRQEGLRRF